MKKIDYSTSLDRQAAASALRVPIRQPDDVACVNDTIQIDGVTSIECRRIIPSNHSGKTIFYVPGTASVAHIPNATTAECSHIARTLDAIIIVIFHRTSTTAKFPLPNNDCSAVINYYLDNSDEYDIDTTKVALGGFSAGTLIAIHLCMANIRKGGIPFKQLILIAPVTSLDINTKRNYDNDAPFVTEFFFERMVTDFVPPRINPTIPLLSPIHNHSNTFVAFPPTVILYGEREAVVPDTKQFISHLKKVRVPVVAIELPDKGHDFPWLENTEHFAELQTPVTDFFDSNAYTEFSSVSRLKTPFLPELFTCGPSPRFKINEYDLSLIHI